MEPGNERLWLFPALMSGLMHVEIAQKKKNGIMLISGEREAWSSLARPRDG